MELEKSGINDGSINQVLVKQEKAPHLSSTEKQPITYSKQGNKEHLDKKPSETQQIQMGKITHDRL